MAHDELTEMLDLDAEVLQDYHRDLIDWVARETAERPRIVDLGAGSGTGTLALARALPSSVVTAVDVAPEMLALIRHRADDAGLRDRVQTVEADLDASWPDLGPVDVIWAAASMHHMADPGHAVAEAFAALRPGGLLVIAELDSFPRFLAGTDDAELEQRAHVETDKRRHQGGLHMHENWAHRVTAAGFTGVVERRFEIDLQPPLPAAAGRYAAVTLRRMRHGLEGRLSSADLKALDRAVERPGDRADLSVRTERTVWLARR